MSSQGYNPIPNIEELPVRGSIDAFGSYLGDCKITASDFVNYKPEVPIGLLEALGLKANAVPLPTEDPATFVMNSTQELLGRLPPDIRASIEFIEVGTESIKDGALPLSQYVLDFFDHDDIMSNESKHACVAAMNAIWRNLGDTGIVLATDIATYADDEHTPASAEFTGGAGSIATALLPDDQGRLIDILDVRGISSGLTYDFYKPYDISGTDVVANTYPIVFGRYSNLANLERVSKAYLNLRKRVNISLDDFSGFVFHTPYPGITKYNLASLLLVEEASFDDQLQFFELIEKAHKFFVSEQYDEIATIERKVKKEILKPIIHTDRFTHLYQRLDPSLRYIAQTGNLYTGSSPLCMLSLLEHVTFDPGQLILWGGYGSGNQAVFMIARTKETTDMAQSYDTQADLDNRRDVPIAHYDTIKQLAHSTSARFQHHDFNGMSEFLHPRAGYYCETSNRFQIRSYNNNKPGQMGRNIHNIATEKVDAINRI